MAKPVTEWKKSTGNTGKCKVCTVMKRYPQRDTNRRLIEGDSVLSVAKAFGCSYATMKKHLGHIKNRQLAQAKRSRDAKEGLDLLKCQKEVYDLSIEAAKTALGKIASKNPDVKPDLRSFGSCISGAAKVVEVLAKIDDKPVVNQTTTVNNYDNLSKEELRELVKLTSKIEGSEEGPGEEKSD